MIKTLTDYLKKIIKNSESNKMKGRTLFSIGVIFFGSLIIISCSSVDIRRGQACPRYGDLNLDISGKNNIKVEGYNGIVTVPADETTKAKAIDNKEALDSFLASYKSICGKEPPFYNEIAYVRRMRAEAEAKKEEELKKESEKKKQEALAILNARKRIGLNLDALDVAIFLWLQLQQQESELYETGQTIKAKRKESEVEQSWEEIKKIFSVGSTISSTSECPFERIMGRSVIGKEELETRRFRLSCYDINKNSIDLLFEFSVNSDILPWEGSNKTSNNLAENFEAESRFTGTIQVVGEWIYGGPTAVELVNKSYYSKQSEIHVKVKIISLQPIN